MSIKTEGVHAGEFLLSEANGARSRENIIINATAGILPAGTLIAPITSANAGSAVADSGNVGAATVGAITVSNDAISGGYVLEVLTAKVGEAAATFSVTGPGGITANGTMGVAFEALGLSFTVTDAVGPAVPAAPGDSYVLTVSAGIGEWVAYDDDGSNDGRRAAGGILYAAVDATSADRRAVGIVRDAEVSARLLTGLDDAGAADLEALGIIVRP